MVIFLMNMVVIHYHFLQWPKVLNQRKHFLIQTIFLIELLFGHNPTENITRKGAMKGIGGQCPALVKRLVNVGDLRVQVVEPTYAVSTRMNANWLSAVARFRNSTRH